MLEVEGIFYSYHQGNHTRDVLKDISFVLNDNSFLTVLGKNGSGKTTLFRILSGILKPSKGQCFFDKQDMTDPSVRQKMGVVFQTSSLDQLLTVRQNLQLCGYVYGMSGKSLDMKIDSLLDDSILKGRDGEPVSQLSGGLRRQVELMKCLLHDPSFLLLDEPTSGLDIESRENFLESLRALRARYDASIMMTTHIASDAVDADYMMILDEGHKIYHDKVQDDDKILSGYHITLTPSLSNDVDPLLAKIQNKGVQVMKVGHKVVCSYVTDVDALLNDVMPQVSLCEEVLVRKMNRNDFIAEAYHLFSQNQHNNNKDE